MPLPSDPQTVWPPKEAEAAGRLYAKWSAWWSGDVDALARVYGTSVGYSGDPKVSAADRRALVSLAPRMFHGAPAAKGALQGSKLHIPLASDIAMTSSDLLFGEPPVLIEPDADKKKTTDGAAARQTPTQDRIDAYMSGGLQAALLEAGEIAAAFGGVYLRVGWDTEIADTPLFDAIPPDAAIPDFRSGRLVAVTFHRVLSNPTGDGKTWRHLERHEPGRILHGLFCSGDDKTLGAKKPLKDHPDTAGFAALPGGGEQVDTGAKGLAAEYIPNMRPNRRLRGSQLGRSDFDGIETVMDGLDEAWSSWMRDLRLGKGRILVPEVYLEGQGRGKGALFDLEQEVFQVVNALPGGGANGGLAMSNVQFNIRVAEHQQTTAALTEVAVRGAGYSAQSFGMQGDGAQATATEVNARQSRSFITRGKKLNYWRPPLARIVYAALQIDVAKFKPAGVTAMLPDVEWPDGIATDPQTLAQTLQLLKAAESASTRTRVELLHPDWDDDRVGAEVKLITDEAVPPPPPGAELLDPPGAATTTGGPTGAPGTAGKPDRPGSTAGPSSGQTPTGNQPAAPPAKTAPAARGPVRPAAVARPRTPAGRRP